VTTLVRMGVAWQAMAVGSVRLISRVVSALFADVTATVELPLVPIFAVPLFGDRMTGIRPWPCSWPSGASSLMCTSTTSTGRERFPT
jgi:hypothetical protein